MSHSIAINGTRLDQIRMPMESERAEVVSSLSFPKNQIRFLAEQDTLRLLVPAFLGLELYRSGILPQDGQTPVKVSISGRSVGRFVVGNVWYPGAYSLASGQVSFVLQRISPHVARGTGRRTKAKVLDEDALVTDITHFLDETGEIASMPTPARKLASFLSLLIEAATSSSSTPDQDSGIRCSTRDCKGSIRTALIPGQEEIVWHCPACGHHGHIRNWHETKWNRLKEVEELM